MELYFVTGNKSKFEEINSVIGGIKQLDIDLPEIQEIDSQKIIEEKLKSALYHSKGSFIVEDNSLLLNGMNGLPGPQIKWFLKTIGNEGIFKLTQIFGSEATAKVIIGFAESPESIIFFEGAVEGNIVEPRGNKGFGWDAIFQPKGLNKTFAEMDFEEKNEYSMRKIAALKLKDYLISKK